VLRCLPGKILPQANVEVSDQWVLFSGAKCNYRRVRVVV